MSSCTGVVAGQSHILTTDMLCKPHSSSYVTMFKLHAELIGELHQFWGMHLCWPLTEVRVCSWQVQPGYGTCQLSKLRMLSAQQSSHPLQQSTCDLSRRGVQVSKHGSTLSHLDGRGSTAAQSQLNRQQWRIAYSCEPVVVLDYATAEATSSGLSSAWHAASAAPPSFSGIQPR